MASEQRYNEDYGLDVDTLKETYTKAVRDFLRNVSFQVPDCHYDITVEKYVVRHFESEGFSEDFLQRVLPILKWTAGFGMTTYCFTSAAVQRVISIFSAYAVIIDDLASELTEDLKNFNARLYRGQQQPNQLLRSFVKFMDVICETYGQFSRDMILKGSMEFINACYFEVEQDGHLNFPPDASDFPDYIRFKTGFSETYALLCFPNDTCPEDSHLRLYLPTIPYLMLFFNYINDILSFYKESVVSQERINMVHNYAKAHNMTPLQALQHLCTSTVEIVRKIRAILSPDPRLQAEFEQLLQGYIVYHLSQSRYRLMELDIPAAHEVIRYIRQLKEQIVKQKLGA